MGSGSGLERGHLAVTWGLPSWPRRGLLGRRLRTRALITGLPVTASVVGRLPPGVAPLPTGGAPPLGRGGGAWRLRPTLSLAPAVRGWIATAMCIPYKGGERLCVLCRLHFTPCSDRYTVFHVSVLSPRLHVVRPDVSPKRGETDCVSVSPDAMFGPGSDRYASLCTRVVRPVVPPRVLSHPFPTASVGCLCPSVPRRLSVASVPRVPRRLCFPRCSVARCALCLSLLSRDFYTLYTRWVWVLSSPLTVLNTEAAVTPLGLGSAPFKPFQK